ncbi:MAG: hypothetical protein U0984_16340 [Prosthecobacter sp.]|nr:hypothetical protein [Prosthecobacter sp.]
MKITADRLNQALSLLAERLEARKAQPCHYVVCGGSSLLALGLVTRTTTRDVDILANFEDGCLTRAQPLPFWLLETAEDVRGQLNLPEKWLNAGPADESFFRLGFPEGIAARLITHQFGPALTISFISRYDQVFFKLYATVDQGPGRHLQDLEELQPTADELLAAARWCINQDPSEGFRNVLAHAVSYLGHGTVVDQL